MQTLRQKAMYWAIACLVAVLPALTVVALHRVISNVAIDAYLPSYNNDEVGYWLYIRAFRDTGFENGYFGIDERTARIGRYDVHGFIYPMIYGTLARLFEWSNASVIYIHVAIVSLGVLVFIVLARLTLRQLGMLAVGLLFMYPLLFHIPSTMQEPLHAAFAFVLAGFFVRGTSQAWQKWELIACLVIIGLAGAVRFWWAIMLLPVLMIATQNTSLKLWARALGATLATGGFAVLLMWGQQFIASPIGGGLFGAFRTSFWHGLSTQLNLMLTNLHYFVRLPLTLNTLQTVFLFAVAVAVLVLLWRRVRGGNWLVRLDAHEWLILYIISVPLLLNITLYASRLAFRILTPVLIIVVMLWIARKNYRWLIAFVAFQVMVFPIFRDEYSLQTYREFIYEDKVAIAQLHEEVNELIAYEADAPSGWCNALLIDWEHYDSRLTALPTGIGVNWWVAADIFDTYIVPKSRYVWFGPKVVKWLNEERLTVYNPITPLLEFRGSVLGINEYSECEPKDVLAGVWAGDTPAYIPVEYFDAPFARYRDSFAQVTGTRTGTAIAQAGQVIIPDAPFWVRPADGIYRQFVLANPSDKTLTLLPSITEAQAQTLAQALQDGEAYIAPNGERAGVFTSMESLAFSPTPKADRAIAMFDGVLELLSVEVPDELEAGEWLPIRLRWRVNVDNGKTFYALVQVWDMDTNNRAIFEGVYDEEIGREHLFYYLYPTQNWQAGEIVEQTRVVRLAGDAPVGGYRVTVAVAYFDGTGIIPRIVDNDGNDQWAVGAKTRITPNLAPIPDDATALDAQFGDSIALTAAHIAQDGSTRTFSLAWQASTQPSTDYTLFIHALDKDGQLLAQTDAPLLAGLYPTSYWGTGQTITSQHTLTLPDDAKIASYNIGLYHPATLERLPATQDGQASPDNVIQLGE